MGYKSSSDPDEPFFNKCPTPEEYIDMWIKRYKVKLPNTLPQDNFQAARFWMAHQIPADNFVEHATPPAQKGGEWKTPYHDRLVYTLKRFMALKSIEQIYVLENIKRGIPYKGDDLDRYKQYVKDHEVMKKAKDEGRFDEYVDEAFRLMKKALRRMNYGLNNPDQPPGGSGRVPGNQGERGHEQ